MVARCYLPRTKHTPFEAEMERERNYKCSYVWMDVFQEEDVDKVAVFLEVYESVFCNLEMNM